MTESSLFDGICQAFQEYEQDLDEIIEETELERDQISSCNDCGESVEDGSVILYPVKNNVVTVQCGACGTVYDEWRKDWTQTSRGENTE